MDDRDLLRHLEEGGSELYDRSDPPALDLAAITGQAVEAPTRRTWSLPPLLVAGGAAACLALGLVGGATLFGGGEAPRQASAPPSTTPARTRQVSLLRFGDSAPANATAQASVFTATDGRTVQLHVDGLPSPRKGDFYELWVLGAGTRMISLGIVRVDRSGTANVRLPLPVSLRRFPVFDLSLEAGDGNPTHSGNSLLRSPAAA